MDRQTATEALKERLTEYVESITDHSRKGNKKAYVCPLCGSGTGRNAVLLQSFKSTIK